MTTPAASALREQVARALAQCHGDQWAESEGEPVEGYGERFAFAWQAEADKCIALIRPAVLREAAEMCEAVSAEHAKAVEEYNRDPGMRPSMLVETGAMRIAKHFADAFRALASAAEAEAAAPSAEAGRETGV